MWPLSYSCWTPLDSNLVEIRNHWLLVKRAKHNGEIFQIKCRIGIFLENWLNLNDDKFCAASCENLQVDMGIFHFLPVLSPRKLSFASNQYFAETLNQLTTNHDCREMSISANHFHHDGECPNFLQSQINDWLAPSWPWQGRIHRLPLEYYRK